MGKPDDIPQDVWVAADQALDNMLCNCIEASGTAEQFRIDSTMPIARAILAERERCAKVAEDMERLSVDSSEWDAGYRVALGSAVAAIRNGGEA